jgi:phenylacetate-CoA ligase
VKASRKKGKNNDNKNFLKFKKLLKFVWENKYSDFYRTKYKKAGFNPLIDFNSIDDVKKIPYLSKDELLSIKPIKLLFINEKGIDVISPTSGTTGKSFFTFHSKCDTSSTCSPMDLGRILILFSHFRSTLFYAGHKSSKRRNWLFTGDTYNLPASCQIAGQLGINTIHTTPTMAILLKDYIEKFPKLKKSLKIFLLCGELINTEKKRFLHRLYPNLKIILSHGLSEIRMTAMQCLNLAQREDKIYYHEEKEYDYYSENISQKSGKDAAMGERGEFVVTNFWNRATPMIRYKTGDIISLEKNNCPCKTPGPLLQFWGRKNYDSVRAGGIEFRTDALEKSLAKLANYVQEGFEVHIHEILSDSKPKLRIVLNLALKNKQKEPEKIKQKIENKLYLNWQLSPRLNFKKAVEVGLFEPLIINFVKFPLSIKTRKVIILE